MTIDKSKLKVWEVPFSTTVSGTILVLAEDAKGAIKFLEEKGEDGSLGWDKDNLAEEGILHDGSMHIHSLNTTEIEGDDENIKEFKELKPEDHQDWDAFEEEETEEA